MDPIKQYDDISFPKLNKNQKASINIATNTVSGYSGEEFEQLYWSG